MSTNGRISFEIIIDENTSANQKRHVLLSFPDYLFGEGRRRK